MNNNEKSNFIDALRGLAVLLVIFVHTSQKIINLDPLTIRLSELGQLGVQLFFIASAYTLCMSHDKRSSERYGIISFYIRRFFRIAPLYYLAIVIYFIFSGVGFYLRGELSDFLPRYTILNVISNVFFFHGFFPSGNNIIVPGGWSIGTEMAFYLIFPFLIALTDAFLRHGTKGILLIFVAYTSLCFVVHHLLQLFVGETIKNNSFGYFNLANQLPVFLIGIAAYKLSNIYPGMFEKTYLNLACFCIFISLSVGVFMTNSSDAYALLPVYSGLAFIFLLFFLKNSDIKFGVLSKIGRVSYSMYIFHFILVRLLPIFLSKIPRLSTIPYGFFAIDFSCTIFLTYLIAIKSEIFIESKGIWMGSNIINWIKRA